jgi:hypothetical protein
MEAEESPNAAGNVGLVLATLLLLKTIMAEAEV